MRQAALTGDPSAQLEIAARLAEGSSVPDYKQAVIWYERAALRGSVPAQFRLAVYLERGVGVDADRNRAKVGTRARQRAAMCAPCITSAS